MTWRPSDPLPDDFRKVAHLVHSDDPFWIPDGEAELEFLFSEQHEYFIRGRASVEVEEGVSRAAAFFHPDRTIDGQPVAFFGYWETQDELDTNRRLFSRLEAWTREQGVHRMFGPIDFSTFRRYRVRLSAPEGAGCFPGEPYNPPYYARLLEMLGYELVAKYVTQGSERPYSEIAARILAEKGASRVEVEAIGLRIEPMTPQMWLENLETFYPLVDLVFGQNFAYSRISQEAFRTSYGAPTAARLCPQTSVIAYDESGAIVGFLLCFPDYGPLVRQGAGEERIPLDEIRYEQHFPMLEKPIFLAKTLGVHPNYRRRSLMNAMSSEALRRSLDLYHHGLVCLMRVDNFSTRFGVLAEQTRTYGLYGKDL